MLTAPKASIPSAPAPLRWSCGIINQLLIICVESEKSKRDRYCEQHRPATGVAAAARGANLKGTRRPVAKDFGGSSYIVLDKGRERSVPASGASQ